MGPIAEAGTLPQTKQYGSTSAHNSIRQDDRNNIGQSLPCFTLSKNAYVKFIPMKAGIGEKFKAGACMIIGSFSFPSGPVTANNLCRQFQHHAEISSVNRGGVVQ